METNLERYAEINDLRNEVQQLILTLTVLELENLKEQLTKKQK